MELKNNNIIEQTIKYYDKNADEYAKFTRGVDFREQEDIFIECLMRKINLEHENNQKNGYKNDLKNDFRHNNNPEEKFKILDFGCGSGIDTKYFLENGFDVDAIDGSKKLCEVAAKYTGIKVRHMVFADLNEVDRYDGIWACASILHVPKSVLPDIFEKMIRALKANGVIYTSFKYGNYEGDINERYYSYFTEDSWKTFFVAFSNKVNIEKLWITGDVISGREGEQWLNIILRKVNTH